MTFLNKQVDALIDSGATECFIDKEYAKRKGLKIEKLLFPIQVKNVDNTENHAGRIFEKIKLHFVIHGRSMEAVFFITHLGKQKIILGLPWLEREDPDISWKKRTLKWRPE